jgi:hypothetical protein
LSLGLPPSQRALGIEQLATYLIPTILERFADRYRSQIPDVNRELAEVGAVFAVFDGLRRDRGR